jgi:gluconolactonase
MRTMIAALALILCATLDGTRCIAAESPIVPEGAKLELLFTRSAPLHGGLTEGPAVAPDGTIYFTDIPFGPAEQTMIHKYDPKSGKVEVFTSHAGKSNGLAFDAEGKLLACDGADGGNRCVTRWNLKPAEAAIVVNRFQNKRFNSPNDLCIDTKGRIYFTDPRYTGNESRELEHRAVYRIDTDRSVVEITHDVEKPNGIALSPDEKTLYVADHNNGTDKIDPAAPPPKTGAMKVLAFPLDTAGLVSGSPRVLVDFGAENGCDGMRVDSQGNIYLTARSLKRPGLMVIDPNGKELAFVPTGPENQTPDKPTGMPSNCEFGIGADNKTLYVTIDKSLYRIALKISGYHVPFKQ